jgi:hydroxymethylpyrimidine pyrophosphatase-like HAD family hydrolase
MAPSRGDQGVIRAVALDLDGTLVGPDDSISERNRRAVHAAAEAGWHVILATARWYQLAGRTADYLGLTGPAIACSGAEVRRLSDGTDLMDVRLPLEFAEALYELCDSNRCLAWFAMDQDVLMRMEGLPPAGIPLPPELRPVERLTGAATGTPRVALIQGTKVNELIVSSLRDRWEDEVRFLTSLSPHGKSILTLTGAGADKGVALSVACAEVGITTAEVVAIGDGENDVEMFRVAGMSFAMGQASDEVKAAATRVTASNAEDGVAVAIEEVLA